MCNRCFSCYQKNPFGGLTEVPVTLGGQQWAELRIEVRISGVGTGQNIKSQLDSRCDNQSPRQIQHGG